jgi:hypothetical protein
MQAAAQQLAFERAGLLKQQMAFAKEWRQKWLGTTGPVEQFNLFLALPVTRRKARKLFLFSHGALVEGPVVAERKLEQDAFAWLAAAARDELAATLAAKEPVQRMEQTWLVAHLLNNKEADSALIVRVLDPDAKAVTASTDAVR